MPLPAGTRLGTYEILSPLGAGGMGEVYRAKDSRLGRDVAIKVLPESMAQDADRLARFEREARTLAALSHPNIVTIFAVEESDGTRFLAMELVDGESLDTFIAAGGLPLSRFFDITVPLAEALSAAHERGIVHRDLKPGNVMITREGRVKVLDFGLAKLETSDSDPNRTDMPTSSRVELTGEGQVFGTVAYMSPEQARGGKVDARSDVFSLGVVLYQLLTGERPFQGGSAVDMISSILRDKPPSVTDLRADLPPHLARILRRCLEKDPRDRYQTSRDVYNELKELRAETATSAPSRRATARPVSADSESGRALRQDSGRTRPQAFWIAVLPFTHSGADPELESFAEGLAEDINGGLAKFPYLSVVSSSSTRRFQAQASDGRAAGEQLGARYVLEGGIRKGASALRVNVQLVDTQTGAHLWAETYNRDLKGSDIFAVQDGITGRVVATVADSYGVLVRSMTAAIQQKADPELSPPEWLFQYFAYRQQLSPPAHTAMKERLERAVERDAGQSDLWACLAQVYTDEHAFGFRTDVTSLDRALAAARRAVELDRANQLGMVSLAQAYFFRRDLAAFRPAAEQAMALNPLNTDALGILGLLIAHTGEFQRGAAIVRRAMELNPNHAGWFHFGPIWEHFQRGEYDRALEHAMQVNMPSMFWQPLVIAAISGQVGRRAEAAAAVRDLLALDPGFAAHARRDIEVWHFASGLLEPVLEGLRQGGLVMASAEAGEAVAPPVSETSSSPSAPISPSSQTGADARPPSDVIRADEGFWVAVLPFRYGGDNADLTTLAEGLTQDIVTGLSRFSYLRVIARSSTAKYADSSADVRSAGKEMGARYIMEASLRHAGGKLRLAVQLVDAVSGVHLWAESYERTFSPEAIFELQDDLVPRIVSTVADSQGVLPHSMSEAVRSKSTDQLSPYEAVLRSFGYFERVTAEELAAARSALELAVGKAPGYADAWAMLALLCAQEYGQGYSLLADSLAHGAIAARRAVEAGPSNHLAHSSLAQVLFLQKDFQAFRNAAARAVALNPMDGATVALMGILLAYAGDWEHGCAMAEGAMRLNPHFPGWYRLASIVNAYRTRDYRAAIDAALRIQMPGYFWTPVFCAAAYGQLDEHEAARKAVAELLAIRPGFGSTVRAELGKWHEPELVEHFIDGLRKAGLEIGAEGRVAEPIAVEGVRSSAPISGATRADEGFWVAVLPFKYGGDNTGLTALAEGLTQDVVTGLSRFSYLRVIARSSTAKYADTSTDVRSAGKELGARYVMEGSLRHAGGKLRLGVQVVDTASGAHLWAENYERAFSPEAVFQVQDDLVPRIVSTVADMNGVLSRSMSEAVRGRAPEDASPYEAVLRSFGYFERVTPEELAAARSALEIAVRKAPAYADALAMLALLCVQDYAQGFNLQPDSLARGLAAARRAVETASSNPLAYFSLAQALFFQKEFESFRHAAERAVALNPADGNSIAFVGELLTYAGDRERGLALAERAKLLNPNHPGWYWYPDFYNAYRQGDDRTALGFALKVNLPGHWGAHVMMAAVCGQLGQRDAAGKALRELLKLRPDVAATLSTDIEKWWDPEFGERLVGGLRKAGLEIAPGPGVVPSGIGFPDSLANDPSGASRASEGFWVAVLPLKHQGAEPGLETLAEGITEGIITGLSRFSYLRVIARGSTARFSSESGDVRAIGKELGARYVMEGSLRGAGSAIRLAVQLVDATTGAHLWAETFDRAFDPREIFALQDQLVPQIVSTIADQHGVLPRTISAAVRNKGDSQMSAYEAVFRVFGLHERMTAEEHATVRDLLERTVRDAPGQGDCWAMLATLYSDEYMFGFNLRPDPLERALAAAQRAVEAAPTSPLASQALAQSLFFRRERQAFRPVAERTIALNPMDGATTAFMGILLACAGDWEHGCTVADAAMRLNPHFPGWYRLAAIFNAYRTRDYRAAIDAALRIQMPGYFWTPALCAAAFGQLGERPAAHKALEELLAIRPEFARAAREEFGKWFEPELVEHLVEGLGKAGLEIAAAADGTRPPTHVSGTIRADEGFWVAVLPFKYGGDNTDLTALAAGLSEEIVTGLSRFSYLRVLSRGSTSRYSSEATDVRSVGKELGARYVLDGSLRQAGSVLRISVQLVDAVSGAHLWAETYTRPFRPEAVFELQDEVVPRIVSTVADTHGILPHSMSETLRDKRPEELTPYEAVLRGLSQVISVSAEAHASVRAGLERAVQEAPGYADCWALLSNLYREEYAHGFNPKPDPLGRALAAARRAVEIAPSNHLAYHALASALFLRREFPAFRSAAERAIALNPMDGFTMAYLASLFAYSGDWERGCAMAKQARDLNPHHPSWYWFSDCFNAYRQGDYRAALDIARKIQMPGFWRMNLALAAAHGQLEERDAAAGTLRELIAAKPEFASRAREELSKWWNADLVEHLIDGLRKAGLEIDPAKAAPTSTLDISRSQAKDPSGTIRADEGFWVAVLPFKYGGDNTDLTALAAGLSEEIVTGLSRFSYLRVISRGSTSRYSSEVTDVRSVGKELGARYVLDGSLRQAGSVLRISVQLVDAVSGAHLWAETYTRSFRPEAVFELQDDVVPRIVSTIADWYGVLPHSMSAAVWSKSLDQLSPYEALLRGFGVYERGTVEAHAAARAGLERAVHEAPDNADSWAMLSFMYGEEFRFGLNALPDPLGRALQAARRAVDAGPSNHFAYSALAQALYFRKEFDAFRSAAERAIALNPMDGATIEYMAHLIAFAGDWERGCDLAERGRELNPNYPGWYWAVQFHNAYRNRDYAGARTFLLKSKNMPANVLLATMLAAVLGQLGEREAAGKAVRELLVLNPAWARVGRTELGKWYLPDHVELLMDGLRKAGLEIAGKEKGENPSPATATTGNAVAPVAIAVLPFSDMSSAKDQEYLCEGMAEEIMNALVRIDGIRVASRTSAFRARQHEKDLGAIARALNVGHVLEGSVRTSSNRIRVTAQLTDVSTGYQLWSERYDRDAADIFAVQDEITAGVVEAVQARLAPGERTVRPRPQVGNLDAYRLYLKGRHLRYTRNDHGGALRAFEEAVRLDPSHAPSWLGLAEVNVLAAMYGLIPAAEAYAAARKALAMAAASQGESAEALYVEGMIHFAERDWPASERVLLRSLELQPDYVQACCWCGMLRSALGRCEDGERHLQHARETDPLAPYPYGMTGAALLLAGRAAEADSYFNQALTFEKENTLALWGSGLALVAQGRDADGVAMLERAATPSHRAGFIGGALGWALAKAGRIDEARGVLDKLRARPEPAPAVVSEAWLLTALGERDAAFRVLERAETECQAFLGLIGLPGFDSLRADPRFAPLVVRLGLMPAAPLGLRA